MRAPSLLSAFATLALALAPSLAIGLVPSHARAQASAPAASNDPSVLRLQAELEEILRAPELRSAMVGVHVRSVTDGRTLFERNGSKLFNPASNMKILTTSAALWYLGSSYRFRTEARRDPVMKNGIVEGNLYLKGHGDPTLTTEEVFGLVNEIALSGITKVKGDLVIDDSFFDGVIEGPGWEQEHSDHAYAAPIGALGVNFGTFTLRVLPGDGIGAPARVLLWPPVPSIEVERSVVTRDPSSRSRLWVGTSRRDPQRIRVSVRGTIGIDDAQGIEVARRVDDPARYSSEMIHAMLNLRGVAVAGRARVGPIPKAGSVLVTTHLSKPLAEITSVLNKYSNNFMAETILKTMGAELSNPPGSWEKGNAAVKRFLLEIGIPEGTFVLGNGSGLNDVNRLTPSQVTRVLEAMYGRFEVQPEFVSSLAVAGSSGTIVGRFENAPASLRLRAKTGTLVGVSALSGYVVTQNGKMLAFSVMMNDYNGRARTMWQIQDRIGNTLAQFRTHDVVALP